MRPACQTCNAALSGCNACGSQTQGSGAFTCTALVVQYSLPEQTSVQWAGHDGLSHSCSASVLEGRRSQQPEDELNPDLRSAHTAPIQRCMSEPKSDCICRMHQTILRQVLKQRDDLFADNFRLHCVCKAAKPERCCPPDHWGVVPT